MKMSFLTDKERKRYHIWESQRIDKQTKEDIKEFGLSQEESIKFKQHNECRLFRCLMCWLMIHPDDEISEHKEGFAHKICIEGKKAFPRRPTNKEKLEWERQECLKCHHSQRVHGVFGYPCFGIARNGYDCKCMQFIAYKDKRII